jgi:hypothetical protein
MLGSANQESSLGTNADDHATYVSGPDRNEEVRPEGLELSTFWFVAEQGQNLSACSGVAYGPKQATRTRALIPSRARK